MNGTGDLDVDQLEARLMSHGVYVTDVERGSDAVELAYESIAASDGIPHGEIGRVINVFRDLSGGSPTRIDATVSDLDGEVQGTWHVEAEWLDELREEAVSETEFSGRVLETIEER